MLPATLVSRPVLHDRLTAGAGKRLTIVVGTAGAGKSVLLSSWAAARPDGTTAWLSCDEADMNPVRFWAGFIEAVRMITPEFGADAADLLAMDGAMSADVTASIANDAAKLPAGSAIIIDDFQSAASAAGTSMADLVERWAAENTQLVLASRSDPPLRLHRLRMAGELSELRDRDLNFSLAESRDLLTKFGAKATAEDLSLLHRRSEGWAAALQMAALSLRCTGDPARVARTLDIRTHTIADYFLSEVLEEQRPELAQFMLETSILGELTEAACAAVTGRPDAAALLRSIDAANLFVVPLDDERTSFRYHHLVRQVLHAELRTRDRMREQALQLRAGEWFESADDTRRAARHFLAACQADRALTLLHDRVVPDFLRDPVLPTALDLSMVAPSILADAPDQLLGVAADLLIGGDMSLGGQYLDLLARSKPPIPAESRLAARFAAMRSFHYSLTGQADKAIDEGLTARAIQERTQLSDEWVAAVPLIFLRAYTNLEDYEAVDREATVALATPELTEPVKLVMVPGARARAWFEAGYMARAADAATAACGEARRLGFDQHFFAVDYLRVLAGLALEQRDLDTAERLTEQALTITEHRRPALEFLTLLDRAAIWAARGQTREALATVEAARRALEGTKSVLLARADELEALLCLSSGDLHTPAELASRLPPARRSFLLAKIALATGDHQAAHEQLKSSSVAVSTPRRALVRQILVAAAAIERGDSTTAVAVAGMIQAARREGFLNTVVTTAPQVPSYLIEHATQAQSDPFIGGLITAALEVRATKPTAKWRRGLTEPLTVAEMRILKLLPTSTYLQIAATLYISRNTVKTHLRSIYQKLGVASRSEAIERAVDLRLL